MLRKFSVVLKVLRAKRVEEGGGTIRRMQMRRGEWRRRGATRRREGREGEGSEGGRHSEEGTGMKKRGHSWCHALLERRVRSCHDGAGTLHRLSRAFEY